MLQKNTSTAFNLAELIVVITILAILGTIGFISLQGYAQSARESSRISDMRTIEKALLLHQTQYETLPLPDNALTLTVSGSIVAYQGDLGPQTLTAIRQAGEVRDPLDDTLYTYTLHSNRRDFQLLGFMERPSSLTYKTSPLNLVSSRR
jgi:type II secretory pathway pseudopilin PulG